MNIGDRSRCLHCGGKIVLIAHPRIISLNTGMWIHSGAVRRAASAHAAVGPTR